MEYGLQLFLKKESWDYTIEASITKSLFLMCFTFSILLHKDNTKLIFMGYGTLALLLSNSVNSVTICKKFDC